MAQRIRSGILQPAQLNQAGIRFLWLELLIFSAIYGLMFKSWLVWGAIFFSLAILLNRPKGPVYMVFALSFLWSIVFFGLGVGFGGWAGGLVTGGIVFWIGVKRHISDLPWRRNTFPTPEPWVWYRSNLN